MSEPRRYEWAYSKPPTGQPSASFAHGVIMIFVGSGYRSMSINDAEALISDLTTAIVAARGACNG